MQIALTDLERLRDLALEQRGFVTASQAGDAGVSAASLSLMVRRGRLERVSHGLYRVPQVPVTQFDPHMKAVLWTGFPEACLSHDSALDAWDISDINPDQIHVTVGAHRRIARVIPDNYVIHHENLTPGEVTWWEGIPTAKPGTAVRQCLASGVPTYLIRQALERSARTGAISAPEREQLAQLLESRHA